MAQKMTKGNQTYTYIWKLTPVNDSITEVQVDIKEEAHSIYNRLTAPFLKQNLKKSRLKR